jgi:mannose-6-phosphate isomerase-like protein (cupin superfamily)
METTVAGVRMVAPTDGREGFLGSIGVRFLLDGSGAGERFSLVEHPMSARALAAPLHLHTREDEYSFVLQGRMGALLGDELVEAGPGDLVFKPRNQWHTFWNAGDEPCRILEINHLAGRVRALLPRAGGHGRCDRGKPGGPGAAQRPLRPRDAARDGSRTPGALRPAHWQASLRRLEAIASRHARRESFGLLRRDTARSTGATGLEPSTSGVTSRRSARSVAGGSYLPTATWPFFAPDGDTSRPEGSIKCSIPIARCGSRKCTRKKKPRFAGLLQSPLTDSNRRPPPYHVVFLANGGNQWQRFLAESSRFGPSAKVNVCHRLRPLCFIPVPSQSGQKRPF